MPQSKYLQANIFKALTMATGLGFFTSAVQAADPVSTYIEAGKPVGAWKMQVGNGLNWGIPVVDQQGKTERGNLVVKPTSKDAENDAINIKWRGKEVKNEWGGNMLHDSTFTVTKHNIDISSVEDLAAIQFDIKVLRQPNKLASISMRCNWTNKCEGKLPLKPLLKQLPEDQWTTLTLPLNCFNQTGNFDFKKVTDIFSISTQGKMEIDLANVGLVALPEGNKGCKK
ncbi:putative glycoside hydrolase [Algibacillus agarilyticus]|uniref:putative glycoside hydrolase n=1 Tax=Algibacillus agarilyticus TaxID=2234133 RepID=UPI000DD06C97|nr:putative glycoside hydrolase [Algibacillus agarilyticus]